MSKVIYRDFAGGLTDDRYTGGDNCALEATNWLINKDKTLRGAPGMEIFSEDAYRVPSNKRIQRLARLSEDDIIAFSDGKAYHVTESAITALTGPTGNDAFNLGDEDALVSIDKQGGTLLCTDSNRSYPIKIFKDGSNDIQLITAGIPEPTSAYGCTTGSSQTYIYAFCWGLTYTVGTASYLDLGPPFFFTATSAPTTTKTLSGLPTLANGSDYNYDTTNVKLFIFRTVNNGGTFYYVKNVSNGTASTTDAQSDTTLVANEPAYFNSGVLSNDPPPPAKYVFSANGVTYWLNILDNTTDAPYRFRQSVATDGDSVPEDNNKDVLGTLTGGASVGRSPIIFTEDETIRLEGIIDDEGRGSIDTNTLSTTVGCIAPNSIVKTNRGLYFASKAGFMFTDGLGEPTKLSKKDVYAGKIDGIYRALSDKEKIQGAYDAINNRVYWTVVQSEADNDVIFVYDETHDAFTTITAASSGILPTALLADEDELIIGDSHGYLFRLSDDYYTFPRLDTSEDATDWYTDAIMYQWKTPFLALGDASINKWFTNINVQGAPETNLAMSIRTYVNGEDDYKELHPIRVSPGINWGDTEFTWGSDSLVWNRVSAANQTRRFAAGRLRARQRSIEFTNYYGLIQRSTADTGSRITVNSVSKLVTLVDVGTYSFGVNNEGYDLVIAGVSYPILSGTDDTLLVSDPDDTLVNGTYEWEIHGYGKGQRPAVMSFSMEYEEVSDAGTFYKASTGDA